MLPVKDNNGILVSLDMASPISLSPLQREHIAPGKSFFSRTDATILVVATDTRGVDGAPFQSTTSPHT